jgi:hypothetical protein
MESLQTNLGRWLWFLGGRERPVEALEVTTTSGPGT